MTTQIFAVAPSNASNASFRAWGAGVSAALAAVGVVKTADSGQIDWATATAPTSSLTASGFEVWRFDDPLSGVAPIVFKLEYGVRGTGSTAAQLTPCLWLTVGKGTDGAGAITGTLAARRILGANYNMNQSSSTATAGYAATCGSKACLILAPWAESTTVTSPMFIIERSRTNDGTPTADAVMVAAQHPEMASTVTTAGTTQARSLSVTAINYESGAYNRGAAPVSLPGIINGAQVAGASSLAVGVIAPSFPWVLYAPGVAPWQSLAVQSYMQGDMVAGTVSVRVLREDHTYRVLPWGQGVYGWGAAIDPDAGQAPSRVAPMILWEG